MIIKLPKIEIVPKKMSIGEIRHVLRPAQDLTIVRTEEIKVGPRTKRTLYILSNEERIVVLPKNQKIDLPDGIDGVIFEDEKNNYHWITHKLINDFEDIFNNQGAAKVCEQIAESWTGQFVFRKEGQNEQGEMVKGLRAPQIGALHAIGAHWSLYSKPATIVMPTGTGKTETMLSALATFGCSPVLVIVPSDTLRTQTARKFLKFGILREIGVLSDIAKNPIVGIINKIPKNKDDLQIFNNCNVIISTMASLYEKDSTEISDEIASIIGTLIVDEAHHLGANSWYKFKESFNKNKLLQFTATPYRRDGKLVDGTVIYNYPLSMAQNDNYFKKISFEPIYEYTKTDSDKSIAEKAVKKLREDIQNGLSHILMARSDNIERAEKVFNIYFQKAKDLKPVLVHSKSKDKKQILKGLISGENKIVVCVDMLGEGFDLPELKIAAIHDIHKSLGILLQFTGRFTRTNTDKIGDATIIANIADTNVSAALDKLYSEDADWNKILSEMSSDAAKEHAELIKFLESSVVLKEGDDSSNMSSQLLNPVMSTLFYTAEEFHPKKFYEGMPKSYNVHNVWLNNQDNTLYFITKSILPLKWARTKSVSDVQWDVFVLHFDSKNNILYISSSDKSMDFDELAFSVGAKAPISGEKMFRALSNINRLVFQNVGVTKHGRRNLRYAMYSGEDVAKALGEAEKVGSRKANITGTGWENGLPMTIGCSYKGRVWSRDQGPIPKLIKWCESVGEKIIDETIDTSQIIKDAMIVKEAKELPDIEVLGIEWPVEFLRKTEERIILKKDGQDDKTFLMFDIKYVKSDKINNTVYFDIVELGGGVWGSFKLQLEEEKGFVVIQTDVQKINVKIGNSEHSLEKYFTGYPPLIRFVDFSELDGNAIIKPNNPKEIDVPDECFDVADWSGIDITQESIWKGGVERKNTIQYFMSDKFVNANYDVVFDDDGAGEAADLVCIKDNKDYIDLVLVHCKFSGAVYSGARIKDIPEVCSQAARSVKWRGEFKKLGGHLRYRERNANSNRGTRFIKGSINKLLDIEELSKYKEVRFNIWIVQPGLSKQNITEDQSMVLSATTSYLKQTVGIDLSIVCSA